MNAARVTRWLPPSLLLGALLLPLVSACAGLQANQLEQRLQVSEKCTLMGQKEPSTTCEAVRQALIGAKQNAGDQAALKCYDQLHARKLDAAKKIFNQAVTKAPRNAHLLACGKDIEGFSKK